MREVAAAVLGDDDHILNAHAALAGDVDARLHRDDHARRADRVVESREARPLVDLEADAVAEAVAERARVRRLDDVARDLVDVAAAHARVHRVDRGELRLQDRVVDRLLLVAHMAERHGARHVGMVALEHRARVHRDEVALLDDRIARDAVALGAVAAGDDDRVERIAVRAELAHVELDLQRDLALGHALADIRQDVLKGRVGDRLRVADLADLLLALHDALRADRVVQRRVEHGLGAVFGAERLKALRLAVGQRGVLHVDARDAVLLEQRRDRVVQVRELLDDRALRLRARRLGIAEVEQVVRLLRGEQQRAVRGRERREVIEICFGNDERRLFCVAADDLFCEPLNRRAHENHHSFCSL